MPCNERGGPGLALAVRAESEPQDWPGLFGGGRDPDRSAPVIGQCGHGGPVVWGGLSAGSPWNWLAPRDRGDGGEIDGVRWGQGAQ